MRTKSWVSQCYSRLRIAIPILFLFFLFPFRIFGQTKTVTGTVRNEKGDPLSEVSIIVKNSKAGTATGTDGRFSINVPDGKNTLVVSSTGYGTREFSVQGLTSLDVELESKSTELSDVVVVAYGGTQKKATLSGAISSISGEEILKSPTINVSNSLAGRVPGLTVVGQGGEPGNDFSTILVRGVNTFGNASPLFVVDGVPLQVSDKLQRIDPSVIESITVLKDASAAIYGSQGANGVILITTKRGKAGRVSVSASFNQGFTQPTKLPELLSSYEMALLQNEVIDDPNSGVTPATYHPGRYIAPELGGLLRNNDPWHYVNIDWVKETLRNWTLQNYANVSISGGSEKLRGFLSLSSRFQDGFYKHGSNKYKQYDLRANMDMSPNKYILFSFDLNGRLDNANYAIDDAGTIFSKVITSSPTKRAYWPNGLLGEAIGPAGIANSPVAISTPLGGYNKIDNYVINTTVKLNVKVPWVEGLSFTTTGTFDRAFAFGKSWHIPVLYNEWDSVSTSDPVFIPQIEGDTRRTLVESTNKNKNYLFNFLGNYEKKIGEHLFKVLYGYEEYERASNSLSVSKKDFDANNLDQLIFGNTEVPLIQSSPGSTRWKNYLGRINYDYHSKIFAEFVFRYQGSTIFRKEDRWGFFPGGSLAYRISEEKFWQDNIPFINSFKIRGSYGETGNDLITPFQYLSLYNGRFTRYVEQVGASGGLDPSNVLEEGTVPNPGVTWEKAKQLDIGFDVVLLNNKLSITFDYFKNKRDDILTPKNGAIPGSTGIRPSVENIGKFLNKGFDFSIEYKNWSGQFKYQIGINGLHSKNKLVFFDEIAGIPEYQKQTGHPLGGQLYFRVLGVYQTAAQLAKQPKGLDGVDARLGDLIFDDVDKNGIVDRVDRVRSSKTDVPTFSGGLNANFEYRNFDLSILIQGAVGAERYLRPAFSLEGNYLKSFYDKRWTPENPNAEFPRVFDGHSAYWSNSFGIYNTFFVRKTDYVRLKNVELGYNLPPSIVTRFKIENLRVYVSGLNLLTIAPDLKDFDTDPEESIRYQFYGESYPLQRVINFGINLRF